jgi:hypothetical protein
VDREDGSATVAKRKSINHVIAAGANADGATLVMQDGTVYRWPADSPEVQQLLASRQTFWGRAALAPGASKLTLVGYQRAFTADLTAPRPKYTAFDAQEIYPAIHFLPDGSRLLAVSYQGELRSVNPDTMGWQVARRDIFESLAGGFGPPMDMVLSRDGSRALVSRTQAGHYRIGVWHLSLETGKGVPLNVPQWHRPTTLAFAPDGRHAVTAESEGGWVGFYDTSNGRSLGFVRAVLEDLSGRSGQVEFPADGRALAVSYTAGYYDHGSTIAVWPWPDVLQAASME